MKLRVYLTAAAALLGCPNLVWAQSAAAPTAGASVPWVADRALGEGAGIASGNVEWHPGVSGEFGYDSNFNQRASSGIDGELAPSLRLRVTPHLSLRTLDRADESGKGSDSALPPVVMFDLSGLASYNEFISLDSSSPVDPPRNVEGGGGILLDFLKKRVWSGQMRGGYSYIAEPSNVGGGFNSFNRHNIDGGGKIHWAPGGGSFSWSVLEYRMRAEIFDKQVFNVYDNLNHDLGTHGYWRFLPKTSVLYDAHVQLIRYGEGGLNDGEALAARMGLNGLLTKKLALLAMGGWAASFYRNQIGLVRNYNAFIGEAQATWFFSPEGRLHDDSADVGASALTLGVVRDFHDSYLGDFYRRDRGYGELSYLIGGRVITTLSGGVARYTYPDYLFQGVAQPGFGETRIDVAGLAEYRPIKTVGINLQLLYDQNISQVITATTFSDDLSFNRFRAIVGARWFL